MYENKFEHELMEVRAGLLTTSNNDWSGGTTLGGAEINKVVDSMIEDALNRDVDFWPLIEKESVSQLAKIWNVRINLGSTNKSRFYSEGGAGTAFLSQKVQLYESAKALRSDYEVSGLMQASSSSYYDALADELGDAVSSHAIALEKSVICGSDASAYGFSGAFPGLLQLMGSFVYNGDTTTVHGIARAGGKAYLDVGVVDASGGALTLAMLDSAITKARKAGAKNDRLVFMCSYERHDEINQLLQAQQRFAGTLNLEGGFSVSTYKRVPIVPSLYMDKNGVNGSGATYADNALYLVNLDRCAFFNVAGVMAQHVPLGASGDDVRKDVSGGYVKTYGAFRFKEFTKHVLVANVAAP
jgi:hypothetical protein